MGEPVDVTAAVICRDGRVLVAQRGSGHLVGKWEFPGGKFDPAQDKDLPSCLKRELREELRVMVEVGEPFPPVICELDSGITIRLHAFLCGIVEGDPTPIVHSALKRICQDELIRRRFPLADIPTVEQLFREGIPP